MSSSKSINVPLFDEVLKHNWNKYFSRQLFVVCIFVCRHLGSVCQSMANLSFKYQNWGKFNQPNYDSLNENIQVVLMTTFDNIVIAIRLDLWQLLTMCSLCCSSRHGCNFVINIGVWTELVLSYSQFWSIWIYLTMTRMIFITFDHF